MEYINSTWIAGTARHDSQEDWIEHLKQKILQQELLISAIQEGHKKLIIENYQQSILIQDLESKVSKSASILRDQEQNPTTWILRKLMVSQDNQNISSELIPDNVEVQKVDRAEEIAQIAATTIIESKKFPAERDIEIDRVKQEYEYEFNRITNRFKKELKDVREIMESVIKIAKQLHKVNVQERNIVFKDKMEAAQECLDDEIAKLEKSCRKKVYSNLQDR